MRRALAQVKKAALIQRSAPLIDKFAGHPLVASVIVSCLAKQQKCDQSRSLFTCSDQAWKKLAPKNPPFHGANLLQRGIKNDVKITHHRAGSPGPSDIESELGKNLRDLRQLHSAGRYHDALELAEHVKIQVIEHFGKKHPVYASAVNNAALMQKMLGNTQEAVDAYTEAVQVYEQIASKYHPSYAAALTNLGLAFKTLAEGTKGLERQGLLDRSVEALEDVVKLRRQLLDHDHPDTAAALAHLGAARGAAGRAAAAQAALREALEMLAGKKESHPLTYALAQNNLAFFLKSAGQLDEARVLYEQALETRRGRLGPGHPDTAVAAHNLAELLQAQGDEEGAGRLRAALLAALEERRRRPAAEGAGGEEAGPAAAGAGLGAGGEAPGGGGK